MLRVLETYNDRREIYYTHVFAEASYLEKMFAITVTSDISGNNVSENK